MRGCHEFDGDGVDATLAVIRRHISEEQMRKFEAYAAEILSCLGMDLKNPATADTPMRFIQALYDATEGYDGDPKLVEVFLTECRGRPRLPPEPDHRRPHTVLLALRTSRPSILWPDMNNQYPTRNIQ